MRYNLIGLLLVLGFIGFIIYISFEMIRFAFFPPILMVFWGLPAMLLILFVYGAFADVILKTPSIQTRSGLTCAYKQHKAIEGGLVEIMFSTYGRNVKDPKIIVKSKGFGAIINFLASMGLIAPIVTCRVVVPEHKFKVLDPKYKDCPELVYTLDTDIYGNEIPSDYDLLRLKYDELKSTLSELINVYEDRKRVSSALTQESQLNILDIAQKTSVVIKDMIITQQKEQKEQKSE